MARETETAEVIKKAGIAVRKAGSSRRTMGPATPPSRSRTPRKRREFADRRESKVADPPGCHERTISRRDRPGGGAGAGSKTLPAPVEGEKPARRRIVQPDSSRSAEGPGERGVEAGRHGVQDVLGGVHSPSC